MIAATPFFAERGCHIRIANEMRELQTMGYDVSLCTYGLGRDIEALHTYRTWNPFGYRHMAPGASWHKLYMDVFLLIVTIYRFIRIKPAVLHAHQFEAFYIAYIVRALCWSSVPIVFDCQGSLSDEFDRYHLQQMNEQGSVSGLIRKNIRRFLRLIEQNAVRRADKTVFSSTQAKDFFVQEYNCSSKQLVVVEDGIDPLFTATYTAEDIREFKQLLGIEEGKKVLIYSGSMTSAKGVDTYMNQVPFLLEHMPDLVCVFAGYGDLVEEYKKEYSEYIREGRIILAGEVEYTDLPRYLSSADIAIDPKPAASTEASGKLRNYEAAGLPTIVFRPVPTAHAQTTIYVNPDTDSFGTSLINAVQKALNMSQKETGGIDNTNNTDNRAHVTNTNHHLISWKKQAAHIAAIYEHLEISR